MTDLNDQTRLLAKLEDQWHALETNAFVIGLLLGFAIGLVPFIVAVTALAFR